MKDIDFDELDRAVSSVLGQSAKGGDEKPVNDAKNDEMSSDVVSQNSAAETKSSQDDTAKSSDSTTEPTKSPTTPLAIKRRGKFMDVMHPSSDMKPTNNTPAKPALPRPVITPLLTEEAESTVEHTSEPMAVLDEAQSLIGAEPAAVTSNLSVSGDETSNNDASTPASETPALAEDEEKIESLPMALAPSDDTFETKNDSAEQTLGSDVPQTEDVSGTDEEVVADMPAGQPTPFLTDTQVEKRPLGAFGDADPETGAPEGSGDAPLTAADAQATPVISLPRELQPDVVGVESVQENEAIEGPGGSSNPFAAKVPVAPEASDGRVEGHPLFDTSTYHEPIAAVQHGVFPGWAKWLIGLLVCLAIGAGVGYFLFTTGL